MNETNVLNLDRLNDIPVHLKLPPPIIFIIFAGLMYVLAEFLPVGSFDFFGRSYLIKALWIAALLISIAAMVQFFRAGTTTSPISPQKSKVLVTKGIYRYSRNPMYLGLLLILLGFGLYLSNAFNTLVAAGFVSYMNAFQIKPEEEALTKLFGKKYQQYCRDVRRWF